MIRLTRRAWLLRALAWGSAAFALSAGAVAAQQSDPPDQAQSPPPSNKGGTLNPSLD
ncbi:MAG: hypothetical protein JO057_05455 [Chloroflexi bacterium]|nr:hypothetical protein [Chloroflexota bacterium]